MNHAVHVRRLAERPGRGRLGRHVEHDERSRAFQVTAGGPIVSKAWACHAAPFEQGDVGSCTGNAMAGLLMTEPFWRAGRTLVEGDAVLLYAQATHFDAIPGSYPPDDTGSSGVAVCRAAKKHGFISGYDHAFGLHAALVALGRSPVITGVNWYEGFDVPQGPHSELVIGGAVRGGHEFAVIAVDVATKRVRMRQSWGPDWGDHGYAVLSFDTWDRLLAEEGDVTVPRP